MRNEIFNVGSDEQNYTIQQVGEIIHHMVPTAELLSMGSGADRRNYRVNFGKIRNTLGFMPQRTLEQGVAQVIKAIRTGKVLDYQDARYSNVKFLDTRGTSHLVRQGSNWTQELLYDTPVVQPETEEEAQMEAVLTARVVGA